ncbi:MAG: polyphenol oxidase family protein [Oligoflexia bacterium]|nr:polyphenol oxidase family protein [Oligoflexia bacterium]
MLFHKTLHCGRFITYSSPEDIDKNYYFVKQVHGSKIIELKNNLINENFNLGEADGILVCDKRSWNTSPPPILAIKTADCLPIVMIGLNGYALLHAGWRGLHQKIVAEPILKKINPYFAFIGPAICQNCYIVGAELLNNFDKKFFVENKNDKNDKNDKSNNKYHLDLLAIAREQILENYPLIDACDIEDSKRCTCCSCNCSCDCDYDGNFNFNSYRRDGTDKRNYNLFIPTS